MDQHTWSTARKNVNRAGLTPPSRAGLRTAFTRRARTLPVVLHTVHMPRPAARTHPRLWTTTPHWIRRRNMHKCRRAPMASPASQDALTYDLQPHPTVAHLQHQPSPASCFSSLSHICPAQHRTTCSLSCPMSRTLHTTSYHSTSQHIQHCPYGQELSHVSLLLALAHPAFALQNLSNAKRHLKVRGFTVRVFGVRECFVFLLFSFFSWFSFFNLSSI